MGSSAPVAFPLLTVPGRAIPCGLMPRELQISSRTAPIFRDETDPRRLHVHREPPQRDVPYVPSDEPVVAAMLRFANVNAKDVVYDLGCGDGRIVIAAAKQCGARAVGVDIDPQR